VSLPVSPFTRRNHDCGSADWTLVRVPEKQQPKPGGSATSTRASSAAAGSTGSTSPLRTAHQRAAAERSAAARARIAARERRHRLTVVASSVGAVLVIVVALVVVKIVTGAGSPKSGTTATAAQQQVITAVTSVPADVLDQVGAGTLSAVPKKITGAALTSGGKPEVLYVGAEYCPFCATERWSVAVALSRFGTFSGLGQTASSPSDVYPSTATLTFHGATYRSAYLSFTAKELQSNKVVNGNYAALDTLTATQQSLVTTVNKGGGIPFIDLGGKYVISGATYDPGVLKGRTHAQIAAALSEPTSPIAKGAGGSANVITAAICASTGNKPAAVCSSAGVTAAAARLGQ
jgi:Domain of unknown function (DUF929)